MKTRFLQIIAMLLLLVMTFTACGGPVDPVDSNDDANQSDAPSTDAPGTSDVYIERPDKEIKNILMIGNSFCTYYPEELYGVAKAAGYELNVVSLYESGCPVKDHWTWLNDNSRNYALYVTSSRYNGTKKQVKIKDPDGKTYNMATVQNALDYAKQELGGDWDVITLQQHFNPGRALDYDKGYGETSEYAKLLFDYIRAEHPDSLLYWHETWAYQVGYAVADKYVEGTNPPQDKAIPDVETQTTSYENIKKICAEIAKENNVTQIPCADAWQIARADARVGDNMCARVGTNGNLGDYYHDGDIGGGQYLNACVWFEVLMGKSCIGNTFRPEYKDTKTGEVYTLSEDMIAGIQEAAHAAVAAMYGPGYAK